MDKYADQAIAVILVVLIVTIIIFKRWYNQCRAEYIKNIKEIDTEFKKVMDEYSKNQEK